MTTTPEKIRETKAMLFGILAAVAVPLAVEYGDWLEEKIEMILGKERPAAVYQVHSQIPEHQAPEQDPHKYTPPKPISDNPYHYIPRRSRGGVQWTLFSEGLNPYLYFSTAIFI